MDRRYLLRKPFKTAKQARILAKAIDFALVLFLSALFYPVGIILSVIYLTVADSLLQGQSAGKFIVGFNVISLEDGNPCSIKQSFIRNLPFIIPLAIFIFPIFGWIIGAILVLPLLILETYLLITLDSGHRLGDVMADTTVMGHDQQGDILRKRKDSWFENEQTT